MAFGESATGADALRSAGDLVAALQRVDSTPLAVSVVGLDDFVDSDRSGLVVAAGAEEAEALRTPLRLAEFTAIDSSSLSYGVGTEAPYAALEAFTTEGRDLVLLGGWSPDGDATASSALQASIGAFAAEEGWTSLSGNLAVTGAVATEPVQIDSNEITPQDEVKDDYSSYAIWFVVAVVVIGLLILLGWIARRRRARRVAAYVDAQERATQEPDSAPHGQHAADPSASPPARPPPPTEHAVTSTIAATPVAPPAARRWWLRAWDRLGQPVTGRQVPGTVVVLVVSLLVGFAACLVTTSSGINLAYADTQSHLAISRRIFDSKAPGFTQLGTVWLPVPSLILIPFVQSLWLWHTGWAAGLLGMICLAGTACGVYRISARVGHLRAGRITAVLLVIANPGVLYAFSTAMTEPVLIVTMVGCFAGLSHWVTSRRTLMAGEMMVFCGLPAAAATPRATRAGCSCSAARSWC